MKDFYFYRFEVALFEQRFSFSPINSQMIRSPVEATSQSPLCYSAFFVRNLFYSKEFFLVLFAWIKRDRPVHVCIYKKQFWDAFVFDILPSRFSPTTWTLFLDLLRSTTPTNSRQRQRRRSPLLRQFIPEGH